MLYFFVSPHFLIDQVEAPDREKLERIPNRWDRHVL